MNTLRDKLLEALEALRRTWANESTALPSDLFSADMQYFSSHRGGAAGREAATTLIRDDFAGWEHVGIVVTNPVAKADDRLGVVAAYLLFEGSRAGNAIQFGGMIVMESERDGDSIHVTTVRIQINWINGELNGERVALAGWTLPTGRHWQPGDPEAAIVSEIDAPWHRVPASSLAATNEQAVAEAWYTYAWGLDMADYALFGECFTEDASALLPPMGDLQGRRSLAGTLKAFRMPWPWIQHYGVPLDIQVDREGETASLVIGRLIPGQTRTPEGVPLFGAHYQIRAARAQGCWRIRRMEYYAGWVTAASGGFSPD
jgi:hypothetical protein